MIFELDEENLRTQSRKMFLLEEQYRIGCRSPFLYLTACRLAAADGSAFRKMNAFTIQVYLFAKKYGILTEEMAFRAIDLAGQMKGFPKRFTKSCSMCMRNTLPFMLSGEFVS